ncbi:MAG: helix-turn-helix domain-containing protein [Candidatus Magasanikbacteria bacterium]|nr:helix-turn-helix domain-containing protein [Candidatus Magasanikbacteria bacterium]
MKKKKRQPKNIIRLSSREKCRLREITRKGRHSARVIKRAQTLLKSEQGMTDKEIAGQIDVTISTVERIRYRFAEGGVKRAVFDAPRPGQPEKLDDTNEAYLIATACSDAPESVDHWTLELLREKLITDKKVKISTTAIWLRLRNHGVKPWLEKNVVYS